MDQYLKLLRTVIEKGTDKPPARENMPGTRSIFGYQMRFDLQEGFPLVTTKKVSFKNVVTELLWFLRGDTNIKYLVDNGCNIWNEDAYNFYKKQIDRYNNFREGHPQSKSTYMSYEDFCKKIKNESLTELRSDSYLPDYTFGDCGKQYGWLWRKWKGQSELTSTGFRDKKVDQISELINGLKNNPMGRRHVVTAWNPTTLDDMALNSCHAFVQLNCRPLTVKQRIKLCNTGLQSSTIDSIVKVNDLDGYKELDIMLNQDNIPKYYLDCQLYQRSADVFLGVPYNIASYALLTNILSLMLNMVPGDFVHSFGDVHLYDNHKEAAEIQLQREPKKLPRLVFMRDKSFWDSFSIDDIKELDYGDFMMSEYNPYPAIKAELSTGLKQNS